MRCDDNEKLLRRQAREYRDRLGDHGAPGSNGHGRGNAWQKLVKRRRRLRRRTCWLIVAAAITLLGLMPRACEVIFTERRRITDAERFIRDLGERRGWSADELQVRLDALHRRYRARPEDER